MPELEQFSAEQLERWGLLDAVRREACRDGLMEAVGDPPEAVMEVLRQQARALADAGKEPPAEAQQVREWRWQEWCRRTFAASLASTYLNRKHQLDQVVFWQLQLQLTDRADRRAEELVGEFYLRLKEGETSFAALASHPDLSVQRRGPVPFEQLPAPLAARLRQASPGVVQPPWPWGGSWLVLQLEQVINASLNEALQTRLLAELGQGRLKRELALLHRGLEQAMVEE